MDSQPYPFSATSIEGGGKVEVGTVAVPITFTSRVKHICLTADDSNTSRIFIGSSNVQGNGNNAFVYLDPGDNMEFDYDDINNKIYAVSSNVGQYLWKGGAL